MYDRNFKFEDKSYFDGSLSNSEETFVPFEDEDMTEVIMDIGE